MASEHDELDDHDGCDDCQGGQVFLILRDYESANREMSGQTVALNMLIDMCLDKIDDRAWVNKIRQQRKGIAND